MNARHNCTETTKQLFIRTKRELELLSNAIIRILRNLSRGILSSPNFRQIKQIVYYQPETVPVVNLKKIKIKIYRHEMLILVIVV